MPFQNINPNDILQGKKECLIQFSTNKRITEVNTTILKIKYASVFPQLVKGTITFEGVDYPYDVDPINFISRMNNFYEIFKNFVVTIDHLTNSLVFTKRDKKISDFTLTTTDNATLNLSYYYGSLPDVKFPVEMTIIDNNNKVLATFTKTPPIKGNAKFDVSSVLKANISQDLVFRSVFNVYQTDLIKQFQITAAAIYDGTLGDRTTFFATRTNLNMEDFTSFVDPGKKLSVNNKRRLVSDFSNEKLYFLNNTSVRLVRDIKITAYTYLRREQETYTKTLTSLASPCIYEVAISWACVKSLFTTIPETEIVEYVVNIDGQEISYARKDFRNYHEFIYINKYSVYDNILFDAKNEEALEVEQTTIQNRENIIAIDKNVFARRLQNTGFILNNERKEHLIDLFSSEKVYEVINGKAWEIIINSDSHLMKQLEETELLNIQFEYSFASFTKTI